MASLDQATMQRIADRQGVQLTPENMARISDFAAANPDILERYSLGTAKPRMEQGPTGTRDIRGGQGPQDNSALLALDRSINKSIENTERPAANAGPEVKPQPQVAAAAKAPVQYPPSIEATTVPAPNTAPVVAPGYEPSTGAPMPGQSGQEGAIRIPTPEYGGGQGGGGFLNWLLPTLLGGAGLAALRGNAGGAAGAAVGGGVGSTVAKQPLRIGQMVDQPPAPRSPQQQTQSPEDIARLRAEVDAENATRAAQEAQAAAKLKAQMDAQATARAAGDVLRGKRK